MLVYIWFGMWRSKANCKINLDIRSIFLFFCYVLMLISFFVNLRMVQLMVAS